MVNCSRALIITVFPGIVLAEDFLERVLLQLCFIDMVEQRWNHLGHNLGRVFVWVQVTNLSHYLHCSERLHRSTIDELLEDGSRPLIAMLLRNKGWWYRARVDRHLIATGNNEVTVLESMN